MKSNTSSSNTEVKVQKTGRRVSLFAWFTKNEMVQTFGNARSEERV